MALTIRELQKIHGVGDVLSRRFLEAGLDTFAKIAAAGEEGLGAIPGTNPRLLTGIVAQARELAGEGGSPTAAETNGVKKLASALRERVQGVALDVRERFREQAAGKRGRKVAKEIVKLTCSLEKLEMEQDPRVKKAGMALAKVERRLEGLGEAGIKKIGKRLKKARKSLLKAYRRG